jgi:hypothetical protein
MKMLKLMLFAATSLFLLPVSASAGLIGDLLDPILGGSDPGVAPVPEPSGALLMGLGLLVAQVARRRSR